MRKLEDTVSSCIHLALFVSRTLRVIAGLARSASSQAFDTSSGLKLSKHGGAIIARQTLVVVIIFILVLSLGNREWLCISGWWC